MPSPARTETSSPSSAVSRALSRNDLDDQAAEIRERIMDGECGSYYEALNVIAEYVNLTGPDKSEAMALGGMSL